MTIREDGTLDGDDLPLVMARNQANLAYDGVAANGVTARFLAAS
jgi:hypothetical protein